jgi:RHS repeat-associated protein
MPLAEVEFKYNSAGAITSTGKYYLHSDHLNTPRLATNQAQALLWSWDSDAFGLGTPNTDVDGDGVLLDIPLRFPGQVFEAYSNLNYNYFRDYEPNTGRYVQSDPIGLEGGLNTYGYVEGNPLAFADPYGLASCDEKLLKCRVSCRKYPHMSGACFEKCESQYGAISNCEVEPKPEQEPKIEPEPAPETIPDKPYPWKDEKGCVHDYAWQWGIWMPLDPICPNNAQCGANAK